MTAHRRGVAEVGVIRAAATPMSAAPATSRTGSTLAGRAAKKGGSALAFELATGIVRRQLKHPDIGAADDPEEHAADDLARSIEQTPCRCATAGGEWGCNTSGNVATPGEPKGPAGAVSADLGLGTGRPLNDSERHFFEAQTGTDLSHVRVHHDGRAAGVADRIGAHAFTRGADIGFAAGAYQPATAAGRNLLAHEVAHVVLGHSAVRRRIDTEGSATYNRQLAQWAAEDAARRQRHEAWSGAVESHRRRDLPSQSKTTGDERDRIALALLAQQSAVIDAVAGGKGWLMSRLTASGYTGPSLPDIKQAWGNALIAAEGLRLTPQGEPPSPDAKIVALDAVAAFYDALAAFSVAAEAAHHGYATSVNDDRRTRHRASLEDYDRRVRIDREATRDTGGDLGGHAFAGGLALARGDRPKEPVYLTEPPPVSGRIAGARARLYAANSAENWAAVAREVDSIAAAFSTLVTQSLPSDSDLRRGTEYLEQLGTRLTGFEQEFPAGVRIPATFYPLDKIVQQPDAPAERPMVVESIPWQLYLVNTRLTPPGQPVRPAGEWQLIDLTSTQRFTNKVPASESDTALMQSGKKVDPPIDIFTELNSKIRFPEGELHFMLPTGQTYVLKTTEPWEWSDFLSAIGVALAAIAVVAAVIATGGAAAPAAVAFYAGLGAAAAGIGSTLAGVHEKNKQGILKSADVDDAMISIGIDLLGALSLGLSRLVTLPAAAARYGLTGNRFVWLKRITLVTKVGVVAGDVYQAWSFTGGFLNALSALEKQPGLSDEERKKMRGQLVRRALLTGALLAVALKGDVHDLTAGRTVRIAHVEGDGSLVLAHPTDGGSVPGERGTHPHAPPGHADVAPHAEVVSPVQAAAGRAGGELQIGPQSHALGVAGEGRTRDFYFCSDHCSPIVSRLAPIVEVLPRNHPERAVFQDLLSRAKGARRRLKAGTLSPEQADAIAGQISADIARHTRVSELFSALMNTDPSVLHSRAAEIRKRLAGDVGIQATQLSAVAERQAAGRGSGADVDPTTGAAARSPIELDVLGGLGIQEAERASKRAQPLHFDTGVFTHTYAEALVPGLPRGLSKEVTVVLPDGTIGRADRVRFITDESGTIIGAHVYEIKPDTPDNIAKGKVQADEYVAGLRAEIEGRLRKEGKAIPATAPDGSPLYSATVMTYNQERMTAVLRAIRSARADATQMAQLEAIARAVFGGAP